MRLYLALLAPTAWVAFGLLVLRDVRWTFLLYVVAGCLLSPWLLLKDRPQAAGGLPFCDRGRQASTWILVQLLVCGPGLLAAYLWLRPWLGNPGAIVDTLRELGWRHEQRVVYAGLFVLMVPWAEEWWWRGRALPRCEARFGAARGRWVNAAAYALYHLVVLWTLYAPLGALLRVLFILGAGRLWAELSARRRNWGLAYLGHLTADASVAAVYLWSMRS